MKSIQLKCKIPDDYRREFHLNLKHSRHRLVVDKNGIEVHKMGNESSDEFVLVLDWLYEVITGVRKELGDL